MLTFFAPNLQDSFFFFFFFYSDCLQHGHGGGVEGRPQPGRPPLPQEERGGPQRPADGLPVYHLLGSLHAVETEINRFEVKTTEENDRMIINCVLKYIIKYHIISMNISQPISRVMHGGIPSITVHHMMPPILTTAWARREIFSLSSLYLVSGQASTSTLAGGTVSMVART